MSIEGFKTWTVFLNDGRTVMVVAHAVLETEDRIIFVNGRDPQFTVAVFVKSNVAGYKFESGPYMFGE